MNKVLLLILDGFGISTNSKGNAIHHALTPNLDYIHANFSGDKLAASGLDVGLPDQTMGNSEVGHLTIGAGRIIPQDLVRINNFLKDSKFTDIAYINRACSMPGRLHLIGLVSDGHVHSSAEHLKLLIKHISEKFPQKRLCIHMITDGRDTSIKSSLKFAQHLDLIISKNKNLFASSVIGRFFAMDRDKRWERTNKALETIKGFGKKQHTCFQDAIKAQHDNGIYDEFINPTSLIGFDGVKSNDQVIFFNFRSDRARQLSMELTKNFINPENFITMTEYSKKFSFPVLFKKNVIKNTLSETIQRAGLRQLKLAETEKYAHVTYFLNGGVEMQFENEDRILIPSCKSVKTYDLKPEMSVFEITDTLVTKMKKNLYSLVVTNFANADMVGHTGNFEAAVLAVESMDKCIGKILPFVDLGWDILLTSDHGNCEHMIDSKMPVTTHTTNPVPVYLISKDKKQLSSGGLCDIAPTVLELLDVDVPNQMTGKSLLLL